LWLRDELDASRCYSWYPRSDEVAVDAGLQLYNAVFYWTDPWSIFVYERLQTRVKHAHAAALHDSMHADMFRILRDEPERTFAILHYPLPHHPYILEADGTCRRPRAADWNKDSVEGYERNLARLDRVVGEIVGVLERAGRFDDATLILTSDHTWRNDPATPRLQEDDLMHVPLILKRPGQASAESITDEFRTSRLAELIARGLEQPAAVPGMARLDPAGE
jgi:arylsulfatase A-like enzyme